MRERLQRLVGMAVDRWVKIPAVSAFVGVGAWVSEDIARDIAETAFRNTRRYGEPRLGQGVTNFFLPPWVRGEVQRAIRIGQENFTTAAKIRAQIGAMVGLSTLDDRRN